MARNIEVKARLRDVPAAHAIARRLSDRPAEQIDQHDTFFRTQLGRLKLRIHTDGRGELIQYDRPDNPSIRLSEYSIASTPDGALLRQILMTALPVIGEVRKTRTLYRVERTRIHVDRVEGLGEFLEIEVVLDSAERPDEGMKVASRLLREFGIEADAVMAEAYLDLLQRPAAR